MRKYLSILGKWCAISFLMLNAIAFLSLWMLSRSSLYKPQFLQNQVTEKEFDYVILGSSTGLTTLDTKAIDSISGLRGLNLSMDDTGISSHYLMLQHFLNSGKSTKTVIVSVLPWTAANTKKSFSGNDYRFLPEIYSSYAYQYFCDFEDKSFPVHSITRYVPLFAVAYYNTEIFFPSIMAAVYPQRRNRFDDRGNYTYPPNVMPAVRKTEKVMLLLSNSYFNKIEQLCKSKNIRLIYYQSPLYNTSVIVEGDTPVINHAGLLGDPKYFYDHHHVNSRGRAVCSAAFAPLLLQSSPDFTR